MPLGIYKRTKEMYDSRRGFRVNHPTKVCQFCNKSFIHQKFSIEAVEKYKIGKFCSRKCQSNAKRKYPTHFNCQTCGQLFENYKRVSLMMYCSRKCVKYKGIGERIELVCKNCNAKFLVQPNEKNRIYCSRLCKNKFQDLGITNDDLKLRASIPYQLWRKKILIRDNFTCKICNKRGGKLHVDHIKPFSLFPELRLIESNGRTLCIPCHKKTDTWGGKILKIKVATKYL